MLCYIVLPTLPSNLISNMASSAVYTHETNINIWYTDMICDMT